MLVGLAILAAGLTMAVIKQFLSFLLYVGPSVHIRISSALDISCSPEVAHRQFALRPSTRRGRVLAGPLDSDGLFDVAIVAPQFAEPESPDQPFVAHVKAKVMQSDTNNHQVMLVLSDGGIVATSQSFTPTKRGCRVDVSEMPGNFTLGMHIMFWLTDQQADNMIEVADTMQSTPNRSNGVAHGVSFLSVATALLSPHEPARETR
jgi:hypothetical protein